MRLTSTSVPRAPVITAESVSSGRNGTTGTWTGSLTGRSAIRMRLDTCASVSLGLQVNKQLSA